MLKQSFRRGFPRDCRVTPVNAGHALPNLKIFAWIRGESQNLMIEICRDRLETGKPRRGLEKIGECRISTCFESNGKQFANPGSAAKRKEIGGESLPCHEHQPTGFLLDKTGQVLNPFFIELVRVRVDHHNGIVLSQLLKSSREDCDPFVASGKVFGVAGIPSLLFQR